ncbi:MAG: hypothetical protein WCR56_00835 [Bacilli bacterium]|jgi:ABC-type Na+ efflux pump permease subunit
MKKLMDYFKTRRINFYFLLSSEVLSFTGLIIYCQTGTNDFVLKLDSVVITFTVLGLVSAFVPFVFSHNRILHFIPYFCYFFAFLNFITSQVNYLANVLVSIDGTSLSIGFLSVAILLFASSILTLVSGCLTKEKSNQVKILKEDTAL